MDGASRFIFDAHCDTATRLMAGKNIDLGKRLGDGHIDFPRMIEGGVRAQVFACWVDPDLPPGRWSASAAAMMAAMQSQIDANPGFAETALSGKEIGRIAGGGKIAAILGVEGGHAIGSDSEALLLLYEKGMRCMTLTWNNTNEIGDSCEGEGMWGGLSSFGRKIVAEMNSKGIVIDCSHASDRTFYDVLECTSRPVLVSHSCMRAICDSPRNMTDEMLIALAYNGGVVGINFFPAFLENESGRRIMALWNRYRKERKELAARYDGDPVKADSELIPVYMELLREIPMPGIRDVADHIEHAAGVAGPEHVGIGSDFDGIAVTPEGLEDVSKVPALAAELEKRGFSERDMGLILGGNLLDLFETVCG